jgi:ABC-type transport system involved in cytochrome c biogenesis permease subunit
MLLVAWCAMLIALLFSRKMKVTLSFGFLISGCALLVAHIGMMNPKITPLVPALSSPLLSIHVSTIMIAYTLLAFVALSGMVTILQVLFISQKNKIRIFAIMEQSRRYSLICLYPAMLFLGAGIFLGAVWANISWGRYWGWDPKETWALITFLVYSLIFHKNQVPLLSGRFSFHVFGLVAFSTVLMTYFGVNYFLGGMHSYAGAINISGVSIIIICSVLLLILLTIGGYIKYKKIRSAEED